MGGARYITAFAIACGVTFGLFWVMQALIGVAGELKEGRPPPSVEFVRLRRALEHEIVQATKATYTLAAWYTRRNSTSSGTSTMSPRTSVIHVRSLRTAITRIPVWVSGRVSSTPFRAQESPTV